MPLRVLRWPFMWKPSTRKPVWFWAPPRMRAPRKPTTTEPGTLVATTLSAPALKSEGIWSTNSESKTSLTTALLVLTTGARSMTLTSSVAVSTSIIRVTSAGALTPTLMPFWWTVFIFGTVAVTSKTPGMSPTNRNSPVALV